MEATCLCLRMRPGAWGQVSNLPYLACARSPLACPRHLHRGRLTASLCGLGHGLSNGPGTEGQN